MVNETETLYVCRRCFSAEISPGACPQCGLPRLECHPGDLNHPSRKPPMDESGRVLCRAPMWWLLLNAPYLHEWQRRRPR